MNEAPRLYRVVIQVSDLEKATDFYSRLLGVSGKRVSPERHYYDCGSVLLGVFGPGRDGDSKARPTPDYLYFSVPDLEAAHARARELDCLSKEVSHVSNPGDIVTRPWGERSFYALDPFENKLCFVDEATIFTG